MFVRYELLSALVFLWGVADSNSFCCSGEFLLPGLPVRIDQISHHWFPLTCRSPFWASLQQGRHSWRLYWAAQRGSVCLSPGWQVSQLCFSRLVVMARLVVKLPVAGSTCLHLFLVHYPIIEWRDLDTSLWCRPNKVCLLYCCAVLVSSLWWCFAYLWPSWTPSSFLCLVCWHPFGFSRFERPRAYLLHRPRIWFWHCLFCFFLINDAVIWPDYPLFYRLESLPLFPFSLQGRVWPLCSGKVYVTVHVCNKFLPLSRLPEVSFIHASPTWAGTPQTAAA